MQDKDLQYLTKQPFFSPLPSVESLHTLPAPISILETGRRTGLSPFALQYPLSIAF